jgi:hypothetical protein
VSGVELSCHRFYILVGSSVLDQTTTKRYLAKSWFASEIKCSLREIQLMKALSQSGHENVSNGHWRVFTHHRPDLEDY